VLPDLLPPLFGSSEAMVTSIQLTANQLSPNFGSMIFATTVPRGGHPSKAPTGFLPARRATAEPVWGDVLGRFMAAALRSRPIRICLVSPWLTETDHGRLRLLVRRADAQNAELLVVTRSPSSRAGEQAIEIVRSARTHRILVNDALHAKMYISQELHGRGVALVGSANMTAGGSHLAEVGILLRPLAESNLIDDLVRVALTQLGARPFVTRRWS
jgi:hypothetical protein